MTARPQATGTLAKVPLTRLLVHMLDRRLSGSLILSTADKRKSAVYFRDGAPAKVRTAELVAPLGDLVAELRFATVEMVKATLERALAQKRLHGQLLLEHAALGKTELDEALRLQIVRKVTWLAALPADTLYGYYPEQNFLETWGGPELTPVEPMSLLWNACRDGERVEVVDELVASAGAKRLRLHPKAQVGRFRFTHGEIGVTDLLRAAPRTVDDLRGSGLGAAPLVERVVYVLMLTHHLEVGGESQPPVGLSAPGSGPAGSVPEAANPPPSGRSSGTHAAVDPSGLPRRSEPPPEAVPTPGQRTHDERRREIEQLLASIDGLDHYEVLGAQPDADAKAIKAAYLAAARVWHPDRLPEPLRDLKPGMTKIFARMTEAHATLVDPAKRAEYDQAREAGGGTPDEQEQIAAVLRAASAAQRADIFVKKRDWASAEREALLALQEDSEQGEYHALLAWVRSMDPARTQRGRFDDLLAALDMAVAKSPESVTARRYRAQVRKKAGRVQGAFDDYQWIAQRLPRDVEAARELRLQQMRSEHGDGAKPAPVAEDGSRRPSIIGRFFKGS